MIERLLWASPWNKTSAIARFGMEVIRQLEQAGVKVDVLRTETGRYLDAPAPAPETGQVFDPGSLNHGQILYGYDAMVANFGDHYGFHGGLLPVLLDTAPIGIFHDAWMGNLLAGWRHDAQRDVKRVDALITDLGADPSGLSAIAAMCSGVVIHGPHYREAVEEACSGPVSAIPLSYTFDPIAPPRFERDRLVVGTVGHINPNKRADEVIRALGFSPRLRERVSYRLIGPVEEKERRRLLDLARRWRAPLPTFTGWLPEEDLRRNLEAVDVICCLRDPCLEGGSASLVTALLSSRPTLVSDHAHYAALPDDVVLKCSPGGEAPDIVTHLERILRSPSEARELGLKGREHALLHHSPEAYAGSLMGAIEASIRAAPLVRAGRRLGGVLSWIAARPTDPVVSRAAAYLDNLVGRSAET
jgi:glycosyltransferase involved in cell wall biosynthesis